MALICILEALTDLLTLILPYITSTNFTCQMRHLCQNAKNAIFDAYASRHILNIYMAILVSKDASGPLECRPMPLNSF